MKFPTFLSLLITFGGICEAIPLPSINISVDGPRRVRLPLRRLQRNVRSLDRRQYSRDTSNSATVPIFQSGGGYVASLSIGTPPREFSFLLDTGSSDLWAGGETCRSVDGGSCGNHTFIGNDTSTTFQDTGRPWSLVYGSGAVNGSIVSDTVGFGNFTVGNHTFGIALSESNNLADSSTPFDGILGLGNTNFSAQKTISIVEALADQGTINEAIVAFSFNRSADTDGEVTFGALDETKFIPSTLVTLDNIGQQLGTGFWMTTVDTVYGNGVDLALNNRTAILDTGTTLLVVPGVDAAVIHAAIPGASLNADGSYRVPCSTNASIALSFGGRAFEITPSDLAFESDGSESVCISAIGILGSGSQWLVGDTFLRSTYFATNANTNEISIASPAA